MNHNCEVNEIIAYLTVSLFATEICTDMTNEVRGKALSLQDSLPHFFLLGGFFCIFPLSKYKLLLLAMLFQGDILLCLFYRQN